MKEKAKSLDSIIDQHMPSTLYAILILLFAAASLPLSIRDFGGFQLGWAVPAFHLFVFDPVHTHLTGRSSAAYHYVLNVDECASCKNPGRVKAAALHFHASWDKAQLESFTLLHHDCCPTPTTALLFFV